MRRVEKRTTVEGTRATLQRANDAGLTSFGFFMLGHVWPSECPGGDIEGETESDVKATIDLGRELLAAGLLDYALFNILTVYPGSPIFREIQRTGRLLWSPEDVASAGYGAIANFVHPNLSAEDLVRLHRAAWRKIALNPRLIARHLGRAMTRPAAVRPLLDTVLRTLRAIRTGNTRRVVASKGP